jgi:seryl-tRNA synthetase
MADELTPAPVAGQQETTAPAVVESPTSAKATTPEAEPQTLEDLQRTMKALLREKQDANKEAQKLRERLKGFETEAEAKRQAEMSETDKLKEQLAQLEVQAKESRIAAWKAQAAAKHGLGDAAEFLTGETQEDIDAQAEKLAKMVNKPPSLTAGATAHGSSGDAKGESPEQRRARLYGSGGGIFENPGASGGGLFWPTEK